MRFPARSTWAVVLVAALPIAAPSGAAAATIPDVNGASRNVPYGSIAERADIGARTASRARQVAAATGMPYFGVVHAAGATSAADTPLVAGQSAQPAAPTAGDVVVNVDSGSGTSTSAWLLGGAAVLLALVAGFVAIQPRWRAERSARASRDRPRAR